MIKETMNSVIIEGQLSEIDLKPMTYERTNNQGGREVREEVEAISGTFKVKVVRKDGVTLDVPVRVFHNKMTKAGKTNPAYASMEAVMSEMVSIAAAGEDAADYVRVSGARIAMNEWLDMEGNEKSYPTITASFVSRVKKEDLQSRANWEAEFFIANITEHVAEDEKDKDYLLIRGIGVNYNLSAQVVPLKIYDKKLADGFMKTFEVGDTVPMSGILNFTSETKEYVEESVIGEDLVKYRTTYASDILITGAKPALEVGFETSEIKEAMDKRLVALQTAKAKAEARANGSNAAASAQVKKAVKDLGF